MSAYAELHCFSNFTFLEGASHAEELVQQAAVLGLKAIAITDRNTLAGVVRAHTAAKDADIQLIVGAQLDFADAPSVLCLPTDLAAYSRLSQLISAGRLRVPKGECLLFWADLTERLDGQQIVLLAPPKPDQDFITRMQNLRDCIGDHLSLGISNLLRGRDRQRIDVWAKIARQENVALLALNDVLYHRPDRARLQDVLAATRHRCTVQQLGLRAESNAERHLKPSEQMAELFRDYPQALSRSLEIAARCRFSLSEIKYVYPEESRGNSPTPQAELERLTWEGAAKRYPAGIPAKVRATVEHELRLVEKLNYAAYFLTVYDIVRYARDECGILCQGRGSAANSVICYCLGVTAVDPERQDLLVERFISAGAQKPPDIDVDFEHERREEVIQYIYRKYTRARRHLRHGHPAYRSKLALRIREVGQVMGLTPDTSAISPRRIWWSMAAIHARLTMCARPASIPIIETDPPGGRCLANELVGFPVAYPSMSAASCSPRRSAVRSVPIEQCRDGRPHLHRNGTRTISTLGPA
jgi:error-prone DNA polymerase